MFRIIVFILILSATFLAAAPQPQPFRRPLVFEPNRGQTSAQVQWLARGPGYQLFLTTEGITMMIQEGAAEPAGSADNSSKQSPGPEFAAAKLKYSIVQMKLAGSRLWNHVTGLEPTGGVSNYIRGKGGKDSLTGIPNYARLSVPDVYNGVDLVFYSHEGNLEYDFEVKPGTDPKKIQLAFEGIEKMRVDEKSGDLVLTTSGGSELRQLRPKAYQRVESRRVEVAGGYELLGHGRASLTVAPYDRGRALVIDPIARFVSTFGGSSSDSAFAVAVDSDGNSYVTGGTSSHDFPVTTDTKWLNCKADFTGFCFGPNIFVTKLSPVGTILYSTYGGVGAGKGIAVDSTGVYVTGNDYPFDCGSFCSPVGFAGGSDFFIWKLSPTGAPIYDQAIAGSGGDFGSAVAVDSQHNAWFVGTTDSPEWLPSGVKNSHVIVAKIGPNGQDVFTRVFASDGTDFASAVAVDPGDKPWVTGKTCGNGWPTTDGLVFHSVGCSVFVMQLSSTGSTLMSTAFGGSATGDSGTGIVPNGDHVAYVTGYTNSANFPTTQGAYQTVRQSAGSQAFVAEIESSTGVGRLLRSTLLGGDGDTAGFAIANVGFGAPYVAGYTTSTAHFPGVTARLSGSPVGFLSKLSQDLTQLEYTELRGGTLYGIAVLRPPAPAGAPSIYTLGGVPEIFVAGTTSISNTSDVLVVKMDDDVAQSQALWLNPATGALVAGVLDSQGNVTSTQKLTVQCGPSNGCSQSWKVIGTLDANRDGLGDILLYNTTTGQLQAWALDSSGTLIGMQSLSRLCGPSDGCSQTWQPAGVGDFNHDGFDDVLWHNNATGELQAWLLDGVGGVKGTLTLSKRCAVTDGCWTRYKLIAIGDFDGDGNDDLFWLDTTTGTVQISLLNGFGVVPGTRVLAKQCGPADGCSTTWKPIGMGDVNRDGHRDLLWGNPATGEISAWLLNGTDRILGTQSLSLKCDPASGCPQNALPVGILRNLHAAP